MTDWVGRPRHLAPAAEQGARRRRDSRTGALPLWFRLLVIVGASAGLWAVIITGVLALVRG
jgi:type VI protein secretion system component VasF